jgi:negative regulator of sigma E activity
MNEERDSQLSAMFDGELSAAECELLARRLAKDDALRGQWSRYSLIGAAIRADAGVRLDFRVAERVAAQLVVDDTVAESAEAAAPVAAVSGGAAARAGRANRWYKPVAGVGIAASVAAASIFWIRAEQPTGAELAAATPPAVSVGETAAAAPLDTTVAATGAPPSPVEFTNGEPASYVVPPVNTAATSIAPATLANYVVAHSEFSGPLSRRLVLSGLVGNEVAAGEVPPAEQPPVPAAEAADGSR